MDYKVTARKWRPQSFSDVVGQENLVKTIQSSLSTGRIPHAFLFSGVRGVGKTTTARIIAKSLNCKNPSKDNEPCNKCSSCLEITGGYSLDVMEIDGASNRGIDNIRELKDTVAYMPLSGKYKVYIIDEVHMLTNEASNALLKTLEEPPPHAVFILATTEAHKVIPTIKSRCQHFVFKKISSRGIVEQLKKIADDEKIKYTEEGLFLIADSADGSMRDAQSVFDQISLYSDGDITEKSAAELLGIPDTHYFTELLESAKTSDIIRMLKTIRDYTSNVGDIKIFTMNMLYFLKQGVLVKKLPYDDELLNIPEKKYGELVVLFESFTQAELIRMIGIFIDLFSTLKGDSSERFLLEAALFKMMDYKNIIPAGELRSELIALMNSGPAGTQQPVRPKQAAGAPAGANAPASAKAGETDDKTALINILSASPVLKSMISSISRIDAAPGNITALVNDMHCFEYLDRNRKEIEQELLKSTGREIRLAFKINPAGERGAGVSQADANPAAEKSEAKKPSAAEEVKAKPKAADQDNDKPQIVNDIVNLFDGKIS